MMRGAPLRTNAAVDRLRGIPLGDLRSELALARTAFLYSQTPPQREKAMDEIAAIKLELARRGAADE